MQLTKFTLTDDLFTEIKQRVDISLQEKTRHNHHLAGNILGEYLMDANFPNLEKFLIECIESNNWYATYLDEEFKKYLRNYEGDTYRLRLNLINLWCNEMYKHEFNPIHSHSGLFSFIIFIQVPFDAEQMQKMSPGVGSNSPKAGYLSFILPDWFKRVAEIYYPVDKSWEQTMLLFPSGLQHLVYPFYEVNEPRITVSGNLAYSKVNNPDL